MAVSVRKGLGRDVASRHFEKVEGDRNAALGQIEAHRAAQTGGAPGDHRDAARQAVAHARRILALLAQGTPGAVPAPDGRPLDDQG